METLLSSTISMKMKNIRQYGLIDALSSLPDIDLLECDSSFSKKDCDIFLCALGFEERCLMIPEHLAGTNHFRCKQALYFKYSTNKVDNEVNEPRLINAFKKFATYITSMESDEEGFTKSFREYLSQVITFQMNPRVVFDLSACSSKIIIGIVTVLFEYDVSLHIVYSEAAIYHPTYEEFENKPDEWKTEESLGIARGVGEVIPSPEHSVLRKENPDLIIAFATFKPKRTDAIITYVDESLQIRNRKRIVWIIGDPHMNEAEKERRKTIMKTINRLTDESITYEVSTFDYKETLKALDNIYENKSIDYHINISSLGSKMQSLGVALFCYIRPDVSVYHAIPKEYNPQKYSEGCKKTWQIYFGNLREVKDSLNKVDQIEIVTSP